MDVLAALIGAVMIGSEPPACDLAVGQHRPCDAQANPPRVEVAFRPMEYNQARALAEASRATLVVFLHAEARSVPGVLVAGVREGQALPGVEGPKVLVAAYGDGMYSAVWLPADATDAQIGAKAAELRGAVDGVRAQRLVRPAPAPPPLTNRPYCGPVG